ncbi:integrase catalytic domain-containing protein [Trichonephila clavata]|uniref:Integrase catalytic domain-containing protein n=1 Tax=Trichonephila clavata TaxID=2740835 RepID=A0A8X6FDV0_TRICU|nr:integrase catalytic domain-containing protein [Trichonephila clavata]
MRHDERCLNSRWKVLRHRKQLSVFIAFVDTFVEDDKEVLSFKLSQFDRLNAKYEPVKEEIFTSLSDLEFNNFDGKITTCNEHIEKLEVLDTETKRLFQMTLESTNIPKGDDFLAFLNKRCLLLENLPSAGTKGKQNIKDSPRHKSFMLHTDANVDKKSNLCSLNHGLYICDKFKNMPVREKILWRPSPEEDIVSYRLKTITYGTKPAPYLATRCLLQLAHEGKNKYPLATPVIQNSTFTDDILSGADDITTAKEMLRQLIGLMKEGCFHLYKWSANSEELLKDVPTEIKEFLFNENDELVKTLGLSWRPREDTFMYQMNLQEVPVTITKKNRLVIFLQIIRSPSTASTDNHKGQNDDSKNLAIKN